MSNLLIATRAEAGTANDKIMTPLRTREAIDAIGVSQSPSFRGQARPWSARRSAAASSRRWTPLVHGKAGVIEFPVGSGTIRRAARKDGLTTPYFTPTSHLSSTPALGGFVWAFPLGEL